MNILFISNGSMPDYQCDMALHGLRDLYGEGVIDSNRVWFLYRSDFLDGKNDLSSLYGRGFSIYGLLEDDSRIDRDDIRTKIRLKAYEKIVYGSVRRCIDYLDDVLRYYDPRDIIFIDGEDDQSILNPVVGRGVYFKRELAHHSALVKPIQFAIPKSKLNTHKTEKSKTFAFIDPNDRSTYIYDNELAYYQDYAESYFAFTQKKAGWDCLRHYEILANGCIPLFRNIEDCPPSTMVFLPKYELWRVTQLIVSAQFNPALNKQDLIYWQDTWKILEESLHNHLTTAALAEYITSKIHQN